MDKLLKSNKLIKKCSYKDDELLFDKKPVTPYFFNMLCDWVENQGQPRPSIDELKECLVKVLTQPTEELSVPKTSSEFDDILVDVENSDLKDKSDTQVLWDKYKEWKSGETNEIVYSGEDGENIAMCVKNVLGFFKYYPPLHDKVKFNESSEFVEYNGYPLTDGNSSELMEMCMDKCIPKLSNKGYVNDALIMLANHHRYNPIKTYFDGLPEYDGKDWIKYLCTDVLKVQCDVDLAVEMLTKTLVAFVKRQYVDNVKFDQITVLFSRTQGSGKSSFWHHLFTFDGVDRANDIAPEEVDPKNKDFLMSLHFACCGNIDEIKVESRLVNTLKILFQKVKDQYRAPYERNVQEHTRRFILTATSNNTDILKDFSDMYERRYWIIPIVEDGHNAESMKRTFDDKELDLHNKVWSQVYYLYNHSNIGNELYLVSDDSRQKLLDIQMGFKYAQNDDYKELMLMFDNEYKLNNDTGYITGDDMLAQLRGGYPTTFTHTGKIQRIRISDVLKVGKQMGLDVTKQTISLNFTNAGWDKRVCKFGRTTAWCYVREIDESVHSVETEQVENIIDQQGELPF